MINEQERLIVLGQFTPNKALTALKKNNKKSFNNAKGSNPSNTNSGHASHASNENSKQKKVYDPCKHFGKTNHLENNCFKAKHLMAKAKKKNSHDSQVALCAFVVLPNNSSSNVEWIMDSGASKHMTSDASLFTSYDNRKHISQKFFISNGKQLSIIGFGNVNVTNGQLEDVFHVERMPINLLSIYCACQKGFKFEAWPDK